MHISANEKPRIPEYPELSRRTTPLPAQPATTQSPQLRLIPVPLQHSPTHPRLIQIPMRRSLRDRAPGLKPLYPRELVHRGSDLQQQLADVHGTRLCTVNSLDSGVVFMADRLSYFGGHGPSIAAGKLHTIYTWHNFVSDYLL